MKHMVESKNVSHVLDLEIPLTDNTCLRLQDNQEKADFFDRFFVEMTKLERIPPSKTTLSPVYPDDAEANYLSTTAEKVFATITSLKLGKAGGLDDLSPKLLRRCSPGVANSLSFIFKRSFRECQVPTALETALIVPVHKGGSKSLLPNYRPIALLSVVSKLIEKVVHQWLEQFLQPVLGSKQSGFKKGDGAHLQLARLIQEWSLAIDSGYMVGVVFFDIKKAFDRVWIPAQAQRCRCSRRRSRLV